MHNGKPAEPYLPVHLWQQLMGRDLPPAALHDRIYGYHFRHDFLDRPGETLQGRFTYMLGQGGQILYLIPGQNMVVLRIGERAQLLHTTLCAAWRALNPSTAMSRS
jgi:hypothetical protein